MFISKREAEERLSAERNIFRDPTRSSNSQPDLSRAPKGEDVDVDETLETELESDIEPPESRGVDGLTPHSIGSPKERSRAGRAEVESESEENDSSNLSLSLSQLDDLLHPRINGRANYRNKLASQVAIAETELYIGETKTGRTFGLSQQQTNAYSRGYRSSADVTNGLPPKPELLSKITRIKEELAVKAAARLGIVLDTLSESKISEIKRATNLSKVAKDMAVILDKCTDTKDDGKGGVHFHIFVPDPVDAERYPTVNVGPKLEGIPSVASVPSTNSND